MVFFEWLRRFRKQEAANATKGLTLEEAIPDAKLLIAFASAYTPKTEQKLIVELVHATSKVAQLTGKKGPVAPDVEAAFWQKYQNLSKELLPVTATTIKCSSSTLNWGPSIAIHAAAAVLLLMLFVVVLAVWATGSTIRADVKLASKDLQEKRKSYADGRAKLALVRANLERLYEESEQPPLKVVGLPMTAARVADLQKSISEKSSDLRKLSSELGPIQTEMRTITLKRDPLITLLEQWYRKATLGAWPPTTKHRIQEAMDEEKKAQDSRAPPEARRWAADETLRVNWVNRVQERVQDAKDVYAIDLLHRVDLILEVQQRYALPLLLGLLGSLTFILRSQIAQVKAQTFHRPFWSLSIARLGLGLIAGLMGGLVITTDDTVLKALPPLALPFILGYAIEVLFAFMDKLVKSFVGEEKNVRPA